MPVPGSSSTARTRVLARDRAYEALKQAILARTILPGERLEDDKLQSWLGMSKTPIRQALHQLQVEGFVETAAQSYTRVVEPRVADAVLHLQTIGIFVLGVFNLTWPALEPECRDELIGELDRLIAALDSEDIDGSIAASQSYYARLLALCPNRALVELADRTLAARAYFVVIAYRELGVQWDEAAGAYRELRDALAAGDLDRIGTATARVFRIVSPDIRAASGRP